MSAGDLWRARERKTKGGGEEANGKVSLKTGESEARGENDARCTGIGAKEKSAGKRAEKLKATLPPLIWNKSGLVQR